jgi:hypothetical protein
MGPKSRVILVEAFLAAAMLKHEKKGPYCDDSNWNADNLPNLER